MRTSIGGGAASASAAIAACQKRSKPRASDARYRHASIAPEMNSPRGREAETRRPGDRLPRRRRHSPSTPAGDGNSSSSDAWSGAAPPFIDSVAERSSSRSAAGDGISSRAGPVSTRASGNQDNGAAALAHEAIERANLGCRQPIEAANHGCVERVEPRGGHAALPGVRAATPRELTLRLSTLNRTSIRVLAGRRCAPTMDAAHRLAPRADRGGGRRP